MPSVAFSLSIVLYVSQILVEVIRVREAKIKKNRTFPDWGNQTSLAALQATILQYCRCFSSDCEQSGWFCKSKVGKNQFKILYFMLFQFIWRKYSRNTYNTYATGLLEIAKNVCSMASYCLTPCELHTFRLGSHFRLLQSKQFLNNGRFVFCFRELRLPLAIPIVIDTRLGWIDYISELTKNLRNHRQFFDIRPPRRPTCKPLRYLSRGVLLNNGQLHKSINASHQIELNADPILIGFNAAVRFSFKAHTSHVVHIDHGLVIPITTWILMMEKQKQNVFSHILFAAIN